MEALWVRGGIALLLLYQEDNRGGAWKRTNECILFGKPARQRTFARQGVVKKIILKWILRKEGDKMPNGLDYLRARTNGGLL
jgi:hypothetical protein